MTDAEVASATGEDAAKLTLDNEFDDQHISQLQHSQLKGLRSWLASTINWFRNLSPAYLKLYGFLDDAQSRTILIVGIVSAIAAGVPLPLIAVVFRGVVDTFPPPDSQLDHALNEIIGIACAYFVLTWLWCCCWGIIGGRISRRIQEALVHRVLGLDIAFFDTDAPDMTSTLTADTQTIQRGVSEKVGLFIQSISYFVATFVTGFVLNAKLTGVLLAIVVPTMTVVVSVGSSRISRFSAKSGLLLTKAGLAAEGAIRAVEVVQAFDVAHVLGDNHARLLREATKQAFKKSIVSALTLALVYFICYCLNAVGFVWASRIGASSGTVYAILFLILDASFVFNQVGPFIQTISQAGGVAQKVLDLINHEVSAIDIYSDKGQQITAKDFQNDLCFENVSFSYPSRKQGKILDSIQLTIPPGQSTAIVGLSGSGKSTVASLLVRLYDPDQGTITIGGTDIKDMHLASLRSNISLVGQDPVLFSGTILDNISHGINDRDELDEQEILRRCTESAKAANADFLENLDEGIHTYIGADHGLSGGQRQRICLARALVRKPALLVLDEPTSALDSESEKKVQEAIQEVVDSGEVTVVTIAHRLATIKSYSNIIVMGHGQVLEQGTHDELVQKESHYKKMVDAQSMNAGDPAPERMETQGSDNTSLTLEGSDDDYSHSRKRTSMSSDDSHTTQDLEYFSAIDIITKCLGMIAPERPILLLGILAAIIQGAIIVGEAIVFGHLINILNTVRDRGTLIHDVDFYGLMFFVISLVALFTSWINSTCFGLASEVLLMRMRDSTLRSILVQDQAWFQTREHSSSALMSTINNDTSQLSGLTGTIIATFFSVSSNVVSGITVAIVFTWEVGLIMLSYIPIILLAGYIRVKCLTLFEKRHSAAFKDAASIASEAVNRIRTVAAFGRESAIFQQYHRAIEEPYRNSFKYLIIGDFALSFSYSIIYFIYPAAYYTGATLVRQGKYTQQEFFTFLPAFLLTAQASTQFFTMAPEATQARGAAEKIFSLIESKPNIMTDEQRPNRMSFLSTKLEEEYEMSPIKNKDHSKSRHALLEASSRPSLSTESPHRPDTSSPSRGSEIVLDDVTLHYPNRPNTAIITSLSLHIQPGQLIGIVGPSGAGKSSMISLLERFYTPTSGTITVDGADISTLPIHEYRRELALVPQEPTLFSGSISFNISLGAGRHVTQEEIEDVCKQCGVHEFVSSLPDGYNTDCGAGGSQLSGGQKQRVAVARALIRKPHILMLDEATSALDSQSEQEVKKAVEMARKEGTTVLVVAHRLSTVQGADRIYVLDKGRLVEQGTHGKLVKEKGLYARMVQAQALG